MTEYNKYFQEDVPSKRLNILSTIKTCKISKLVRYSRHPPEESLKIYDIPQSSLFRLTAGPLLMTLESGLTLGFASLPEKVSITVWIEETESGEHGNEMLITEDNELFPIDSCDKIYGDKKIGELIGKQVIALKIIKRESQSYRLASRPCEVGLIFKFSGGSELILSHGLHNGSDDFAVIYRHEILPDFLDKIHESLIL